MQRMAVGYFGVMRGLFVIARLGMLGGFPMVLGRMLVMVRGEFKPTFCGASEPNPLRRDRLATKRRYSASRRISAADKAVRSDTRDYRGARAASENPRQTATAASAACRGRRPRAPPRCPPI